MTKKLVELKEIMETSGLTKSPQFLEEHFMLDEARKNVPRKVMRKDQPAMDEVDGRVQGSRFVNFNENHKRGSAKSICSRSAETIYRNAVQKRISSSSEEEGITSDGDNENILDFIAEPNFEPDYNDVEGTGMGNLELKDGQYGNARDQVQPGPSHQMPAVPVMDGYREHEPERILSAEETAQKVVIEAENNKILRCTRTGKNEAMVSVTTSAMMDEDYLFIGGHIEEAMKAKIINGEYVDFSKLLPRERMYSEDENKLELIIKNGKTFWVPASESVAINGFSRWEQAFRIYSNVLHQKVSSLLIGTNSIQSRNSHHR